ncbi:MAG: multidrug efflux system membrane fusion protein [Oceanospirillaceae bacterium]|jgi:multidrug efflux system membrane fusion protein
MNKSIFLALVVVIALGLWMSSGADSNANETVKQAKAETKPLMKVSALSSKITTVQRFVTIQGQVEANRTVDIKVEVDGRIAELPVDEGDRIKEGVSIVTLSADYRLKKLSQAKAVLRQRNSDLSATIKLKKRGLIAVNRVIADQAAVQTARADLATIQHEVNSAKVFAPFNGVLNSRGVEMGDYLQKGDVIGTLVDDASLKVTGQVPQKSVGDLQLNEAVEISLSNGLTAFGKLRFISRVADSVTRSYRVEVLLDNPQLKRLIGLTASLKLPLGIEKGHLLPNSVLGLNSNGDLEIKLIDNKNQVRSAIVTIIRTDKSGFWLKGLSDQVTVITQGKDFVSEAQIVDPVAEPQNSAKTDDSNKVSSNLQAVQG